MNEWDDEMIEARWLNINNEMMKEMILKRMNLNKQSSDPTNVKQWEVSCKAWDKDGGQYSTII